MYSCLCFVFLFFFPNFKILRVLLLAQCHLSSENVTLQYPGKPFSRLLKNNFSYSSLSLLFQSIDYLTRLRQSSKERALSLHQFIASGERLKRKVFFRNLCSCLLHGDYSCRQMLNSVFCHWKVQRALRRPMKVIFKRIHICRKEQAASAVAVQRIKAEQIFFLNDK